MFAENFAPTFVFPPFESFSRAAQDLRRLPFADNCEHFISLRSPSGAGVQFAFQSPFSVFNLGCFSGFLSPAHPAAPFFLPRRLDSIRCERF